MSSRRPGMASCASARLAGVVVIAMPPSAAVVAVCVTSEDMLRGRVRVVVVEASDNARQICVNFSIRADWQALTIDGTAE